MRIYEWWMFIMDLEEVDWWHFLGMFENYLFSSETFKNYSDIFIIASYLKQLMKMCREINRVIFRTCSIDMQSTKKNLSAMQGRAECKITCVSFLNKTNKSLCTYVKINAMICFLVALFTTNTSFTLGTSMNFEAGHNQQAIFNKQKIYTQVLKGSFKWRAEHGSVIEKTCVHKCTPQHREAIMRIRRQRWLFWKSFSVDSSANE